MQGWGALLGPEAPGDYYDGVAAFDLAKPQRDNLVLSDLPEDLIDHIFKVAGLHTAEGTADRVRCAAVCREWASILSAPCYWRELQLDTADFDGRSFFLRRRRSERQRQQRRAATNDMSSAAAALALPPQPAAAAAAHASGLLLRRHHHLDRAPADAGARAAFADALLRLAERAGGALERVRVVSARTGGDVGAGGGGVFFGGAGIGGGPRRDGGGAFALLDEEDDDEHEEREGEQQAAAEEEVEDEQGAGPSRAGNAPPRLFYGDGVCDLEPFPGARVGFRGAGRELEAWLSATATKLAALSSVGREKERRRKREQGSGSRDTSSEEEDSDDSLIAAVGVFGEGDAAALARAELARAEAAAARERLGASVRLQAALCGKPFGGKRRLSGAGAGGGAGGGRSRRRRRSGRLTTLGSSRAEEGEEPLARWALRVAAYLCFRAFRGALRAVLRWRRGGRGSGARSYNSYYYSSTSSSSPSGREGVSAAIDGALTLAAVALAARLLVAAFALPALALAAARGALSLLGAAAAAAAATATAAA